MVRARFLARTTGIHTNPKIAPWRGVEDSAHPVRSADVITDSFQGYAKNVYPWLSS